MGKLNVIVKFEGICTKKTFRFDVRPTKGIWRMMELFLIGDKLTQGQLMEYLEIDTAISQLQKLLFEKTSKCYSYII